MYEFSLESPQQTSNLMWYKSMVRCGGPTVLNQRVYIDNTVLDCYLSFTKNGYYAEKN